VLIHPIKTIIFDLDGTLRHNIPSADDFQYKYAQQLGVNESPGKQLKGARWAHFYWAQSSDFYADIEQFGGMNDGFWNNYAYRYLLSLTVPVKQAVDLAPKLFEHMQMAFNPIDHVYPCVPETLQAVKDAGYFLGLVSNRSTPCQEQCEALGLLRYFDFAYVAAEVDAWKPDPRIFDRALEISDALPEETLYIGDNYYADILGAKNAGIQPVLLDPKSIFPEANCTVIRTIRDLGAMLF
jgi:HAD superfamily hydrolase (TIGR01549 family)